MFPNYYFHPKADADFLNSLTENELLMVREELPGYDLTINVLQGEGQDNRITFFVDINVCIQR